MVGVAACSSVSSIKALWETRIRRIQEEDEEQRKRTARGGATGRSDSASSAWVNFCRPKKNVWRFSAKHP